MENDRAKDILHTHQIVKEIARHHFYDITSQEWAVDTQSAQGSISTGIYDQHARQ